MKAEDFEGWGACCEFRCGRLEILVGPGLLQFAAEHRPDLWDGKSGWDTPNVKITNIDTFAQEVVREINREDEDGSTALTRMLDRAIRRAVEDGCEGMDHSEQQQGELQW